MEILKKFHKWLQKATWNGSLESLMADLFTIVATADVFAKNVSMTETGLMLCLMLLFDILSIVKRWDYRKSKEWEKDNERVIQCIVQICDVVSMWPNWNLNVFRICFFSNQRNWMFVAILLLAIKKPHSSNCYEDNQ